MWPGSRDDDARLLPGLTQGCEEFCRELHSRAGSTASLSARHFDLLSRSRSGPVTFPAKRMVSHHRKVVVGPPDIHHAHKIVAATRTHRAILSGQLSPLFTTAPAPRIRWLDGRATLPGSSSALAMSCSIIRRC